MNEPTGSDLDGDKPTTRRGLVTFTFCIGFVVAVVTCLGIWQVQRLSWKLDLIERVDARVAAPAVAAPPPNEWNAINAADSEYRHVRLTGTFLHDKEAQVYALTERGAGFWVMTPLQRDDGTVVFINRGFVPTDSRDPAIRPEGNVTGEQTITGLLRLPETGGLFLRKNNPGDDRWYMRNPVELAEARGIGNVAPYFVDADDAPNPGGLPIGGMTRIVFTNNHLVYAITWFALAIMGTAFIIYVWRSERKRRGPSS
ncbi:SURF1 family protein [Rhizobium sp. CFBP 8762]|uniref:SURF1 family protein n=1 Tax=Rhizobium sp. CFBP 8762 TaxID=2775279 RepID=UPI0017813FE2|nr:SURF1 family protein [Rhizobium sp. CFBP 8762]MBD8554122.1 SURF1 family protein [Rhizobium sp. CFBP 8762]